MAQNLKSTETSELDQEIEIQTTDSEDVERAGTDTKTHWVNAKWATYNSYYKNHLSCKSVMNKLSMWTMGTGLTADKRTKNILDKINGWGKDTIHEILDNQIRIESINGDSYAEIITPEGEELKSNGSNLLNLKPLNPGSIGHVINSQGILEGYKQKLTDGKEKPFRLNQIFHLCLNRTADEIHGTGDIGSLMTFLDKIKQLDEDMSVMFHRFVVPMIIWKLNTDDPTAVLDFKTKQETAFNKGNNLVTPDKAVDWKLLEAGKTGINPMDWRNKWTEEVIKGGGVPALIMAIESGTTEASSKMVFMAWQMTIDSRQKKVEAQVKLQLGLKIKLPDPPKIDTNSVESDEKKDGNPTSKIKKSETTTSLEGAK